MEKNCPTLRQRRLRVPVVALLACMLAAIAFVHINAFGIYSCHSHTEGFPRADSGGPYEDCMRHGWPVPFARHKVIARGGTWKASFADQVNVFAWDSFHVESTKGMICDAFLWFTLTAATGAAFLRLERRRWARLQFSIADMFSLMATASMVLGLIYLDNHLSFRGQPVVDDLYVWLRDLPWFDRVMVLFAVACAVWLIVSTVTDRLGDKRAER
jgi:hypothetical protein